MPLLLASYLIPFVPVNWNESSSLEQTKRGKKIVLSEIIKWVSIHTIGNKKIITILDEIFTLWFNCYAYCCCAYIHTKIEFYGGALWVRLDLLFSHETNIHIVFLSEPSVTRVHVLMNRILPITQRIIKYRKYTSNWTHDYI